jgi:hypothetical protein
MREALKRVNVHLKERYGVLLANRTGINTGEVVAVDDQGASQKLATGTPSTSPPGSSRRRRPTDLSRAATYRLVRDAIEAEPVEPLALKGKSEKVPAFRLIAARGLDGYARREDSPIVGRDDELTASTRCCSRTRSRAGRASSPSSATPASASRGSRAR